MVLCPKCEKENEETRKFCCDCGAKIQDTDAEIVTKVDTMTVGANSNIRGKKSISIAVICLLVLAIAGTIWGIAYSRNKATIENKARQEKIEQQELVTKSYQENLISVIDSMLDDGAVCETILNNYLRVWNEAVQAGSGGTRVKGSSENNFSDVVFVVRDQNKDKIEQVKRHLSQYKSKMRELNHPPDNYKSAYASAKKLFDIFNEYVAQTDSPTGSLQSFNQKINVLGSEFIKIYNELQLGLPK